MQKIVNITLHKDSTGNYAVSVVPSVITVAVLDEDDDPVTVKWVLREPNDNINFPNASQLAVSFSDLPTPFTITSGSDPLPATEQYITAPNGDGAAVETPVAQDHLQKNENSKLHKYTVTVKTMDGQEIVVDPHVRFVRRRLSRTVWD